MGEIGGGGGEGGRRTWNEEQKKKEVSSERHCYISESSTYDFLQGNHISL